MKDKKRFIIARVFLCVVILLASLFGCAPNNPSETNDDNKSLADKATDYMYKNLVPTNSKWRHTYHAQSPVGWTNDPNGFTHHNGKTHLFFQYYPFDPTPGIRYWGHMTTQDFVRWDYLPVALAPDKYYESQAGCWSGTALTVDDNLYIMYTGTDSGLQQQCIARSSDGINFEKFDNNPVIGIFQVGKNHSYNDFRDPKLIAKDGRYYALAATLFENKPTVVMYTSDDLRNWSYVNRVLNCTDVFAPGYFVFDGMYECPDYVVVDGTELMILSVLNYPKSGAEFQNIDSCGYIAGSMDFDKGTFSSSKLVQLDGGFDFYAAQTCTLPDGRVVLTAWMQNWNRTYPTQESGWAGSYVLPRELTFVNGRLYQTPVAEIENYRQNKVSASRTITNQTARFDGVCGNAIELNAELDVSQATTAGINLFVGKNHKTTLTYNVFDGLLTLDRSNSGVKIDGVDENMKTRSVSVAPVDGKISLRIFLDKSSVEVFANDGYATMTSLVYPDEGDIGVEFFCQGSCVVNVAKYDIVVL